jgi:acyl carrier protein
MTGGVPEPTVATPYAEVVEVLRRTTGEDAAWAARIGPDTRIEGDLLLDSLEVVAVAESLHARYDGQVDLLGYIAALDIDQIIDLTVADVARFVQTRRHLVGRV